jgi:hypothetical protein
MYDHHLIQVSGSNSSQLAAAIFLRAAVASSSSASSDDEELELDLELVHQEDAVVCLL